LLAVLSVLFFCSGTSALIYQVLWVRMLGLTFGVTVYAASTVAASVMAGLAIGSLAAGRVADRVRRPLAWFGAAELLIGLTAFATPAALARLQQAWVRVSPSLPTSLSSLTLVRFAIVFAVLIVPTALMGATLPLVLKSSAFRATRLGERMALLYGMNTAGAIAGTLAAGLSLIPSRGIHATFTCAAALNLLVGMSAFALSFTARPEPVGAEAIEPAPKNDDDGIAATERTGRPVVLAVFALSGFTSLALEIVWFRVLSLFLRPTVYGYALMLAAVLAGLALGSYIVTPLLDRRRPWLAILAALQIAVGCAAVLSFATLARMVRVSAALTPLLSRLMAEWLVYPTIGSLLAIFPTSLLMGVAFPIGLRIWAADQHGGPGFASRVGTFYSLNVTGAILGSIAGGFLLLPRFGSQGSLILLGAISAASGLALLAASRLTARAKLGGAIASCLLFGTAVAASPNPFDEFVRQRYRGQQIVWRDEGVDATVVVLRARNGEVSLTVNGNHQASTGGSQVYLHRSIGHLPMLLHPDARDALIIGLGGGATAGAVAIHDGVDVDVVELADSVVRGAHFLRDASYDIFSRPNVHVHVDDGRNHLLLTRRKYDVVTADVIHPIFAGSGNLYSAEYFRLMRSVLKPNGLVVQWVAGTDAEYKIIARTFLSVFPEATAWGDGTLLVGSVEPLKLRRHDFDWKLQMPGRRQGAHDFGVRSFEDLVARYRAGPAELRRFVGEGPILTDDRPLVEYFLSLPRDRDMDLSGLGRDPRGIAAPE
jgi:spermidine synthase